MRVYSALNSWGRPRGCPGDVGTTFIAEAKEPHRHLCGFATDGETKRSAIGSWQSEISHPENLMTNARATWIEKQRFNGVSDSGHTIVLDGDKAAGNSPMEVV